MSFARDRAQPTGDGFAPYAWAPSVAEVAARHGLPPQAVLKLDQNTPPLPGVPQIPLAQSMASIHTYPDGTYRELCEAAASYTGTRPENVVVGAGADDLILLLGQVFVGPGTRAAIDPPTYPVYRIATTIRGGELTGPDDPAHLYWICNPNNPLGTWVDPEPIVERARSTDGIVVVDEAYVEFGARSCAPWIDELENLVVIRTMSKAFGFAGLRVGYALAHPETAALLTERRPPAPISGFAASIAAAALRDPRLGDVEATIAERERVREALVAAGYESWPTATNFVYVKTDEPLGERLEAEGIVVRVYRDGIRVTLGRPAENDRFLAVLGVEPGRSGGREATVLRTTTETALRLTLALDGGGRTRVETGIGFLDHLLTLLAFHAGFDLELLAAGDLAVDDHHTVEDVHAALGSALTQALGSREGVARYGSAVVPMDEARATAAVDLVRRPHAEIDLAFGGDRVGTLAVSLLRHALERFAIEAGCTVHVDAAGSDDHHVAEAAYKALGQALRQAVASGGEGIRSTKGEA
jgi:histidinol-phosphate aminotransferase